MGENLLKVMCFIWYSGGFEIGVVENFILLVFF